MIVYILSFCIGSCFGSFFTVVSERLPLGLSLIRPTSHCTKCQTPLKACDLVPVASYLYLKGHCRYCQQPYPKISFNAEIVTGLLFCLLTATKLWSLWFIPGLLLILTALLLSLTDILYLLVEPVIFYPLTLCTALSIFFIDSPFSLHAIEGLICLLFLAGLTKLIPNSLGHGDVLLLSSWGLFLGLLELNLVLLQACLLALFYGLISGRKTKDEPIPFVPFLAFALISQLIWQFGLIVH